MILTDLIKEIVHNFTLGPEKITAQNFLRDVKKKKCFLIKIQLMIVMTFVLIPAPFSISLKQIFTELRN